MGDKKYFNKLNELIPKGLENAVKISKVARKLGVPKDSIEYILDDYRKKEIASNDTLDFVYVPYIRGDRVAMVRVEDYFKNIALELKEEFEKE